MKLNSIYRFRNKKKTLESLKQRLQVLLKEEKLSESELEALASFTRDRLSMAHSPELYCTSLDEFFTQFPQFKAEQIKENALCTEALESAITQSLVEDGNMDALEALKSLDVSDDKKLLAWIHGLSEWNQSKAYDQVPFSL